MKTESEEKWRRKRVLLIGKPGEEAGAWRGYLEAEFDVTIEPNPEEAILSFKWRLPDVILLNDVCEGPLDGIRALRLIKKRARGIPGVFLTGTGYANNSYLAIRSGAASYLLNPCRGADLSLKIHEALGPSRGPIGQAQEYQKAAP